MRSLNSNFKKIHKKQLRYIDRLSVRSVLKPFGKLSHPDPTFEDRARIVQSVHRRNRPKVDKSNPNISSRRNSP